LLPFFATVHMQLDADCNSVIMWLAAAAPWHWAVSRGLLPPGECIRNRQLSAWTSSWLGPRTTSNIGSNTSTSSRLAIVAILSTKPPVEKLLRVQQMWKHICTQQKHLLLNITVDQFTALNIFHMCRTTKLVLQLNKTYGPNSWHDVVLLQLQHYALVTFIFNSRPEKDNTS